MKRFDIYIAVFAALIIAAACSKEKSALPEGYSPRITLSDPMVTGTRAILHSDDFTGDTSMEVYDYKTSYSSQNDTIVSFHFTNIVAYGSGSDPDWDFVNTVPDGGYQWFENKAPINHSFISWLIKDKAGLEAGSLFGTGATGLSFNEDTKVLTVPATTMTLSTTQFDFCYSTILERKKERADYSPVSMPLHHLFTSFGVKAYNYTSDKITLTSVKLYGLVNNKGAQVAYDIAKGKTAVTYGSGSTRLSAVELVNTSAPIAMNANTGVNNIITSTGLATSASNPFFLMWPQTAADLNITTTPTVNTSGVVTAGSGQAFLVIGYKVNDGATVTYKAIPLRPESWVDSETGKNTVGWDAGTCHQIEIAFTDTQVGLTVTVQPWDLYEPEIDYSGEIQVKSTGKLAFSGNGTTCTVDEDNRRVYFKGGNPITATFTIDAPLDATWMISKKGDYDAFEIDDTAQGSFGDKVDNATGTIDGNQVTFTIYPKISDPDKDREINLAFSVRLSNGNVYSVDNLIQGDPATTTYYTIVLQAS